MEEKMNLRWIFDFPSRKQPSAHTYDDRSKYGEERAQYTILSFDKNDVIVTQSEERKTKFPPLLGSADRTPG